MQQQQSKNEPTPEDRNLVKFLLASVSFLFIGTIHGVLQIQPPIRAWLDSIGSPYGGPGHMIDPLAHAHINLIGGVVLLGMAVTYYLLPRISGHAIFSQKLVNHTFWWTALGICGFYSTLMVFGILEGTLLLQNDITGVEEAHSYYTPIIATVSTGMGIGFWVFFFNIFFTAKNIYKK
ncbi:MAG: cbb3-type cytochrome c oxidase subunit I [Gammaproteobacteria bacterium]|nr:cbb3-type cytochrome c oxidase subunit I [Gammaproteobacteria bacterium]